VLDVEFCKLLSIKVVGNYFAEHNKVALSVIMKKVASKRAYVSSQLLPMRERDLMCALNLTIVLVSCAVRRPSRASPCGSSWLRAPRLHRPAQRLQTIR
jgi:hypothetical protein